MVAINNGSMRANLYETIYDTLTSANLLSSTVTVTAAYIDDDDDKFPQVVIHPVDVSKSPLSFDRTHYSNDMSVMIDVWTKKNKEKDQISDEIDALLSPLKISGACLVDWSESNALEPVGGNKIHLKTIVISYRR